MRRLFSTGRWGWGWTIARGLWGASPRVGRQCLLLYSCLYRLLWWRLCLRLMIARGHSMVLQQVRLLSAIEFRGFGG